MQTFSVLLSVYKNEKSENLKDALESISIKQSIQPNEIILVKDGSLTPELEDMLSRLNKRINYLKVFGYEENQGLGFALNFGLKRCTNELVFRMDTDDIACPNRFETQLKCFAKNAEISFLGTKIEEFNKTPGDLKKFRNVPLTFEEIQKNKFKRNPFNHMTVLFKKSIIEEVGGYKEMSGYEDYYLWIRLLKQFKGMNIDEPLVFARIGNDMIKRRHGLEFLKKEFQFQYRLLFENHISLVNFCKNLIIRCLPRILPIYILKIIYLKVLRK
ncbi:MAG: glycosyltransferase [Oceanospirillaceae bacterium]|nr:glycosyltransferase [Oceanospirillaceae bacterium]